MKKLVNPQFKKNRLQMGTWGQWLLGCKAETVPDRWAGAV